MKQKVELSFIVRDLLSVDDLEPLLHLAALGAPALLVGDQRDVRVFGDAVVACAAVNAALVVIA